MRVQHQQCNNLLTGVNLNSKHFTNRDKIKMQLTTTATNTRNVNCS